LQRCSDESGNSKLRYFWGLMFSKSWIVMTIWNESSEQRPKKSTQSVNEENIQDWSLILSPIGTKHSSR
jgi:hypothetical protein